jgi:hypothetical protein
METEDAGARQCKNLYQEWIYIETIDGDNFDGQACRINEGMVLAMDSANDSMMEVGNSTKTSGYSLC